MKFSLGGSSGDWWGKFAKNFTDRGGEIGKFGKGFTTSLSNTRDYLSDRRTVSGDIGDMLFHQKNPTGRLSGGLDRLSDNTMGWSRQLNPLWEGGLTKSGGTFKDIFGNEEEGGLLAMWSARAGHHLFGRDVYADKGGGGSGGSGATVDDSEDPSLINQGNWTAAAQIGKIDRRNLAEIKAGGYHDRAKTQRGRLNVKDIS
tara:strand:- start:26266 stop:26868 length:603 start_codon:yes stop_codon:yes gene_type:complete